MRALRYLIVSLALTVTAAVIASIVTTPVIPLWYATLAKPAWTPPNWVFGPVWTLLYVLMAFALFLVWTTPGGGASVRRSVGWFVAHLVVNVLWSVVFFGTQNVVIGFAVILFLFVLILFVIGMFAHVDRRAAWLLVPYLAWVGFATVLNGAIVYLSF